MGEQTKKSRNQHVKMAATGASIVCHWPVAIITPWFSVFDFNIVGNNQPVSPKSVIIRIKLVSGQ